MRKRVIQTALLIVSATSGFASAANIADFTDYTLYNPSGQIDLPGRLFIPPEAISNPGTTRPLMVFLHGGGASGTDNLAQVIQTPDFMLDEAKRRGAYLYVPQTSSNWTSTVTVDSVMTMIDRAIVEKQVNSNRLYATGFSNGGGGTWNLLSRNPGRFAAALAVSGVAPAFGFNATNLLGSAIMALHARDDATVPVARTRAVVSAILAAAGQPLPVYPSAHSDLFYLVSNPSFEFHRELAASAPPGSTTNYLISRPDLDLIYLEQPIGGHTGLFSAFYAPPIYDWMFARRLTIPEPRSLFFVASGLLVSALNWRRRQG